ncbi:hypothetical protein ANN_19909 [Periplaneta americana]|uniref:Uncharacterized protein n=1 Tax=Periplaneta americana TaxID=6978 RepID=A0ABQ8SBI7_PERAM|nr:hypothetical protein ANN_19909 [Periplaneta americana]
MSPGSSTESYPAFAHIGLRENPGKNLNQVTCPDRESNPGHLVSRPDVPTVTPQATKENIEGGRFDPVLWIEFSVAQWSERLVRRTKDSDSESDMEKNTKSVKLMLKAHSYMVVTYEEELWPGNVLEVKNNGAVVSCIGYVAAVLGIPRSTVQRVYLRFRETRDYSRRPGSGRKRVTSARDDHFIVLNTLRNRHSTAIETRTAFQKIRQVNVSERTVRGRLDECG